MRGASVPPPESSGPALQLIERGPAAVRVAGDGRGRGDWPFFAAFVLGFFGVKPRILGVGSGLSHGTGAARTAGAAVGLDKHPPRDRRADRRGGDALRLLGSRALHLRDRLG